MGRAGVVVVGSVALAATAAPLAGQGEWADVATTVEARDWRIESYMGREALVVENGVVRLDGIELRDGVIEFDLAASASLGFYGLAFRTRDSADYEHIYVRPFQSGRPDATQYTPVYNGVSGWQLYAGPAYGRALDIATDRWVRVRIAFRDQRATLSVDGETIVFPRLERDAVAGGLALTASGAPARFAGLVVREGADPITAADGDPDPAPDGVIHRWRVSTPFAESRLDVPETHDFGAWRDLGWDRLEAGVRGIANLARIRALTAEANTVLAAVTLRADSARPARLRFGFSDRVVLYLNGRPLYRGEAGWRSRDPRFLGTVGLFDEVILPLRAGDNELVLAVSESFGGWGVTAALEATDGVRVAP